MKINNKQIRLALIALIFVVYWIFSPYLKDIQNSANDPAASETYIENTEELQGDAAQGSSVSDGPEGQAISSSEHAVISPFSEGFSLDDIPPYSGEAYTFINDNTPFFSDETMDSELESEPWEGFSELDELGRCGPAMALLHRSLMPDGERSDISEVKPTGWKAPLVFDISSNASESHALSSFHGVDTAAKLFCLILIPSHFLHELFSCRQTVLRPDLLLAVIEHHLSEIICST